MTNLSEFRGLDVEQIIEKGEGVCKCCGELKMSDDFPFLNGKQCKACYAIKRKRAGARYYSKNTEKRKEYQRNRSKTLEGKRVRRRACAKYAQTPHGKVARKRVHSKYAKTEKGKGVQRRASKKYRCSDQGRAVTREYNKTPIAIDNRIRSIFKYIENHPRCDLNYWMYLIKINERVFSIDQAFGYDGSFHDIISGGEVNCRLRLRTDDNGKT